jgi:cell division septation protein DedD
MHIRRPPPGDGPTIYRPNESVAVRLDPPPRPVAYEPESIPPSPTSARESILLRVNRSRGQILTVMVSVAAIASFGSVVWWAHNQDVKAGGRGLEPLIVQGPDKPSRFKPDNPGGMVPPDQDKEVFNRISPGATPIQPEKLLAEPTTPKLPPNGMPVPAGAKPAASDADTKTAAVAPATPTTPAPGQTPSQTGATPPPAATPPAPLPTITQVPATQPAESGPSIANLIEGLSGPSGGWRVQVASVKNEDVAKSTWARLQSAHGEALANLRMQAVRVDLGDKGVWYRVQAGPLDEKQAQSVCTSLKSRKTDCVTVPPAR